MKKIFLFAIGALLVGSTANAQVLKQSGNEKNLQVLLAPLGGNPISIDGISFRKFNATGTSAWRVNLFIGMTNSKDILHPAGEAKDSTGGYLYPTKDTLGNAILDHGTNPEADKKKSSFTFSIRPGYEKHFAGTERLSPYIGAELMFSMTTATTKTDNIGVSNVSYAESPSTVTTTSNPYTLYTTERKGDGSSTTFGLNLIAGVDYYIAKSLSLGVELGFGYSMTTMPDVTDQYVLPTTAYTGTIPNRTVSKSTEIKNYPSEKKGNSSQFGPNAVAQFKLGWLF